MQCNDAKGEKIVLTCETFRKTLNGKKFLQGCEETTETCGTNSNAAYTYPANSSTEINNAAYNYPANSSTEINNAAYNYPANSSTEITEITECKDRYHTVSKTIDVDVRCMNEPGCLKGWMKTSRVVNEMEPCDEASDNAEGEVIAARGFNLRQPPHP